MSRRKPNPGDRKKKRQPPIRIPLSFEQTVKGFLALSPEDAKDVRESRPGKRAGRKEG
jgi:hypothetical protein